MSTMEQKIKVLLVDDDKEFIDLVSTKLKSYGFTVTSTTDPDQAIPLASKLQPVIILLDIQMPKKDGFQVAYELSQALDMAKVKVVFFTSLGENHPQIINNNKRLSKEFGVVDYIKKSTDLDIIANTIEHLANNKNGS